MYRNEYQSTYLHSIAAAHTSTPKSVDKVFGTQRAPGLVVAAGLPVLVMEDDVVGLSVTN